MNDFISWEVLATFAGATAVTALLTQWLKNTEPVAKLPTQWLSYFIALALMVGATAASGGWAQPWQVWALVPLNAVIVSTSSNGTYAIGKRVIEGKEKTE